MFQVKPLTRADYAFAVELANTMDWNMTTIDFDFAAALEPGGSFLLVEGSKRLGIATCVSYGKVGWFGNLIIKEGNRKKGGGTALVTHAIEYLHTKGVETIGLYAYPHLVGFYNSLNFKTNDDLSVLFTENMGLVADEKLTKVGVRDLSKINTFDINCFGGDRKRLLESIILSEDNKSYCASEDGEIVGYVAATVYPKVAWIGPLICKPKKAEVAFSLVKTILADLSGKRIYAVVPKKNVQLLDFFMGVGFKETFFVTRMFLGKTPAKNCIYMAESLERG